MSSTAQLPTTYTPQQVAQILQISKNTVYNLISRGEILAQRIGRVYRIPISSIQFVFDGIDHDLTQAEQIDAKNLHLTQSELKKARRKVWVS